MFFLNPAHAGISAIIYSSSGILNLPRNSEHLGESLLIAHNPYAKNPLLNQLTFGQEWQGDEAGAWKIKDNLEFEKPNVFDYLD